MRALITGGAGFIGSHLADYLNKRGWFIRIVDNFSTGRLENIAHLIKRSNVEVIKADLKNLDVVNKVVRDVDVVFHLAANPEVRIGSINPEIHLKENILVTFNILESMRKNDVNEIVFASSSSVYGEPEKIPVDEQAPIRPVSIYGASKASCENLIHAYTKTYGFRAVILRYANVIGPRLRHGVIYDLLMKLKQNSSKLEVLGDGLQVRSFLYISDAIEASLIAYTKTHERYSVFNIGNLDWISVSDIVKIILKELNLNNVKIIYKPYAHGIGWPGDVKKIVLAINKILSLGFNPKYNSKDAVKFTVRALINELHVKSLQ